MTAGIEAQTALVPGRRIALGKRHLGMGKLMQDKSQKQRGDEVEDAEEEGGGVAEHRWVALLDLYAAGPVGLIASFVATQVVIDGGLDAGGELLAGADEMNLGLNRDDRLEPVAEGAVWVEANVATGRGLNGLVPRLPTGAGSVKVVNRGPLTPGSARRRCAAGRRRAAGRYGVAGRR